MENNLQLELIQIFENAGKEAYFGEPVSQFEHAAQAMQLASQHGLCNSIQVAAFLHDIGHMLAINSADANYTVDQYGNMHHEKAAVSWLLQRGFTDEVIIPIAQHVNAKRYLCTVDKGYYDRLSEASKATLLYQGGPMHAKDVEIFQKQKYFEDIIQLRLIDDAAKMQDMAIPSLASCVEKVNQYITEKLVTKKTTKHNYKNI